MVLILYYDFDKKKNGISRTFKIETLIAKPIITSKEMTWNV